MGDKSPKSTQKKAGQKEAKVNEAKRKKQAANDTKRPGQAVGGGHLARLVLVGVGEHGARPIALSTRR
jgi:hypothetical protein